MLAWLGFVATEFVKLPGDVHNVSPVEAHNAAVASGSAFQVLAFIAALEFISVVAVKEMLEGSGRQPGEFGFDPLGFWKGTQADKDKMAAKELENGRTAMLAFAGVVTQAVLTGKGFPYLP
jgi:light-harvesting complex I chlorophyll a/b binding protein 1